MSYRDFIQERESRNTDFLTHDAAFSYSYRWGNHNLGIDGLINSNNPDPGAYTNSYRIGVVYTLSFDRPPPPSPVSPAPVAAAAEGDFAGTIAGIPPGTTLPSRP